jgi:hypothetical protein
MGLASTLPSLRGPENQGEDWGLEGAKPMPASLATGREACANPHWILALLAQTGRPWMTRRLDTEPRPSAVRASRCERKKRDSTAASVAAALPPSRRSTAAQRVRGPAMPCGLRIRMISSGPGRESASEGPVSLVLTFQFQSRDHRVVGCRRSHSQCR